mmetsp:Transcript_57526/g.135065  ORF Transcript_57526/g.135065 Transcript_57526/m.135065 type:complete len:427 (-) Transcript_57526:2226-3506(-)
MLTSCSSAAAAVKLLSSSVSRRSLSGPALSRRFSSVYSSSETTSSGSRAFWNQIERQLSSGPSFSSSWKRKSAFGSSSGFVSEPVTCRNTPTASSFCPSSSATERESCWFFSFSASDPKSARAACPRSHSIAACPRNVLGCTLRNDLWSLIITACRIALASKSTWNSSASVIPSACTWMRMQSGETGGTSSCWVSAVDFCGAGAMSMPWFWFSPSSPSSTKPSISVSPPPCPPPPSSSSSSSSPSRTAAREFAATWLAAAAAFLAASCSAARRSASCWLNCAAAAACDASLSRRMRSSSCRFFSCSRTACTMRVYLPRVIVRRQMLCSDTTDRYLRRCSRFCFSSSRARKRRAEFWRTMARPPRSWARWRSILSTTSRLRRIIVLPSRTCFSGICIAFIIAWHVDRESPPTGTSGQMQEKVPMNSA